MDKRQRKSILLVDEADSNLDIMAGLLEDRYEVFVATDGVTALEVAREQHPDLVLFDIMMPGMDGFELCRRLRADRELQEMRIVFVSSKAYKSDREQAFALGADGYITKPIDAGTFSDQVRRVLEDSITLSFWGVRGTMPMSGPETLRYGGRTICVGIEFPRDRFFIFDAGTGIKGLSDHIMARRKGRIDTRLFISHPHLDHINAFPFFVPLYIEGNEIELLGPPQGGTSLEGLFAGMMDGIYFPVKSKHFNARVTFRDLWEGAQEIDGIEVRTMLLNHPGNCLGYRLSYNDKSICYVTDNELFPEDSPSFSTEYRDKLVSFIQGADILITDNTYTDEEYRSKAGWGHSSTSQVVDLAHRAGVGKLLLIHHDPDQLDEAIDAKLATARRLLAELGSETECIAPAENESLEL